jgi:hypothetical protein
MSRWWTLLPMLVAAAVPLATSPTAPVLALVTLAALMCCGGIVLRVTGLVSAAAAFATIGYAVALWLAKAAATDVVGAALFGLALLFLLDSGEFTRRFYGALIARDVMRAQTRYWLGRAAFAAAAVAGLTFVASALAGAVPGSGRAALAGLGAVIAFAGALRSGIVRRPGSP